MENPLPKQSIFKGEPTLFRRFIAFVLDILLLNIIVISPFGSIFARMQQPSLVEQYQFLLTNPEGMHTVIPILIFIGIMMVLYFAVFEYFWRQTLGKMIMHLYVESDQNRLTFFQCIIRNMELIPFFPFYVLLIVDPLFLAFGRERLSEKISRTRVITYYLYQP